MKKELFTLNDYGNITINLKSIMDMQISPDRCEYFV